MKKLLLAMLAITAIGGSVAHAETATTPAASPFATTPGTAPTPADAGAFGIGFVWVKDWDKFREYNVRVEPILKKYGASLTGRALPFPGMEIPGLGAPSLMDTFYLKNAENAGKIFEDPEFQKLVAFRDAEATHKVLFLMGSSIHPVADHGSLPFNF